MPRFAIYLLATGHIVRVIHCLAAEIEQQLREDEAARPIDEAAVVAGHRMGAEGLEPIEGWAPAPSLHIQFTV